MVESGRAGMRWLFLLLLHVLRYACQGVLKQHSQVLRSEIFVMKKRNIANALSVPV
jgi:hypothetical protein